MRLTRKERERIRQAAKARLPTVGFDAKLAEAGTRPIRGDSGADELSEIVVKGQLTIYDFMTETGLIVESD